MTFEQRISAFAELGQFFNYLVDKTSPNDQELQTKFKDAEADALLLMQDAQDYNQWFTQDSIRFAFKSWANALTPENLTHWVAPYSFNPTPKTVGIIMAGNLPLVGFHDLLAVILSGHHAKIKPSSKDEKLMKLVVNYLIGINAEFSQSLEIIERLNNFDAVIATGSNNTARYFEHYFAQVPSIIRKNRTSVAVLNGKESKEELAALTNDIFTYYGLGCRNVTKLYFNDEKQIPLFFDAVFPWGDTIIHHTKYANNYDYNRAIFLLGKNDFLDNNFVLLKKEAALHSAIAVINYEIYTDLSAVKTSLDEQQDAIQCVLGNDFKDHSSYVPFGQTQSPALTDYADGIDTLAFLEQL